MIKAWTIDDELELIGIKIKTLKRTKRFDLIIPFQYKIIKLLETYRSNYGDEFKKVRTRIINAKLKLNQYKQRR